MNDTPEPVVDAEVVGDGSGQALPPLDQGGALVQTHGGMAAPSLFRTSDPIEIVQEATKVANALKGVLDQANLTTKIGNKDHVEIEGWQTLGAMLGVTPICVSTRRIEPQTTYTRKGKKRKWGKVDGKRQVIEEIDYEFEVVGHDWEAAVEARTADGRTIGRAEAMVSRHENDWAERDDYALRSMAQTRASSRALASILRFVVVLAGLSGTPAEEMNTAADPTAPAGPAYGPEVDDKTARTLRAALKWLLPQKGAKAVWDALKADADDYVPQVAAKSLIDAISRRKAIDEPSEDDGNGGDDKTSEKDATKTETTT